MASMQNPNLQQTYEDFKPLMEEKDTPDALLLLVHLPGFNREQFGASFDANTRKIKVFGEKPLDNSKRKRFKEEYVIPETCDSRKPKAKFDGTVVTITMPKKPISSVTPEVPKPAQEAAKQITPPTSKTSGVEAEGAIKEGEKGVSQEQLKSEMESQREPDEKKDETPTPREATTGESEKLQKDKEEIPQKGIKEEEKHTDEMEAKDASTPAKADSESRMSQKDQEGTPQKGKLEDEKQKEDKAEKTSGAGKERQKAQTLAREASKDNGSSGIKTPEKGKEEKDVKTGEVNQRNHGKKESDELSIAKGIKGVANSASQAVTRLADRVREEDKQKLLYAAAAILMVAVGIYATFKLRTSGRQ